MNHSRQNDRRPDRRTDYVCRFDVALRRTLGARHEHNVDDIAQAENLRLLTHFEKVAARYAEPEVYAQVRATAARADHYRANNCQRGAGAHFRKNDDGGVLRGREVVSGDARTGEDGVSLFDVEQDRGQGVEDEVVSKAQVDWLVDVARELVGEIDAAALERSAILGLDDGVLAAEFGVARETVNRRKNRAARAVKGRLSADNVE